MKFKIEHLLGARTLWTDSLNTKPLAIIHIHSYTLVHFVGCSYRNSYAWRVASTKRRSRPKHVICTRRSGQTLHNTHTQHAPRLNSPHARSLTEAETGLRAQSFTLKTCTQKRRRRAHNYVHKHWIDVVGAHNNMPCSPEHEAFKPQTNTHFELWENTRTSIANKHITDTHIYLLIN